MPRLLATTLLVGGLCVAAVATPAAAHWMGDSGAFSWDTGSEGSDTSSATDDTGAENGADTGSDEDTGSVDDGDTGSDTDTGSVNNGDTTEVYSAAELANDKGGCSTAGGSHTPWLAILFGALLGLGRRRLA